jgi:Uma2 family endonuclease
MEKMGEALKKEDARYTYGEYLGWPDDERWELIHGIAWSMSPAPGRRHQLLLGKLHYFFRKPFEGHPCEVYLAPFDVRIPEGDDQKDEDIDTVVQPDISVICDTAKLDERGCRGAPDLAVEILSPYTARKDLAHKFELYQSSGVREYWIVDPGNRYVRVYTRGTEGKFGEGILYQTDAEAKSVIFPALVVDLAALFKDLP